MVTIISKGTPPPPKKQWPYDGDELTCPCCKSVFVLDEGDADNYLVHRPIQLGGRSILIGLCPVCFNDLRTEEPKRGPSFGMARPVSRVGLGRIQ